MKFWFILILFLSIGIAHGQQLKFHNYALWAEQAKQPAEIIKQDGGGMIWTATGNHLFQFDGLNFINQSLSIPENVSISTLYPKGGDREGLYLGLTNGHLMFGGNQEFFVADSSTFGDSPITSIVEDNKGQLWVATYEEGLYLKNNTTSTFEPFRSVAEADIYDMVADPQNGVWLATDAGLYHCSFSNEKAQVRHFGLEDGLSDEIVKSMKRTNDGLLLGTHEKGIVWFDFQSQQFKQISKEWTFGSIRALDFYGDREVWIATERHDVLTVDLVSKELNVVRDQDGASFRQVLDVLVDREGNIWLGSYTYSLLRAFRKFEFYSIGKSDVQAVIPLSENRVLLGTSGGLFDYNLTSGKWAIVPNTAGHNIVTFHQMGAYIFYGTFDKGAFYINTQEEDMRVRSVKGLEHQSVITIAHTSTEIWFSTLSGLSTSTFFDVEGRLIINKIQPYNRLSRNYVYDIYVESDSSIYFATDGHGVAHDRSGNVEYYNQEHEKNTQVYSIVRGLSGGLWVLENSSGLCDLDQEQEKIHCDGWTKGMDITAVASDGDGHIVVVHTDGIDIVNEVTRAMDSYGVEFGFDDFDSHINSIRQLNSGNLFVATSNGVVKVQQSTSYDTTPEIAFNFVKVGDQSIDPRQHHEFAPQEHTIQFGLQGLYYSNPESIRFRYKLEGHDAEWQTTKDKVVIYSKLPPGEYRFEVQAISDFSVTRESRVLRFDFTLLPPFYIRWWFIGLAILSMLLIVIVIVRFRDRSIARTKELQRANLERQYEVLKNQLNPHFLFNAFNTLVGYIEEDPSTAVIVVEKLTNFYRKILEVKQYRLVSLDEELALLDDYVYLLNKRFDNNLKLDVRIKREIGYVPPMTLQILVENAVKHNVLSRAYPLSVVIEDVDKRSFCVRNNIKPKRNIGQSTGIGLKNIDERYRLLNLGPILVRKDEGVFSVILPKIRTNKL